MHAISSYRGITVPQTHRQDRLKYTAPQLAHSVKKALRDANTARWL